MDRTALLYALFVAVAVGVAIWERVYALANERRLLAGGAREVAAWVFRLMAPVYSLIFPAALAEHLALDRRPSAPLALAMVALFLLAKALKLWAVLQLRGHWTMKVIVPRSFRVVCTGPYRYLRHPNYVAVLAEVLVLPLAGGAWITALAGGAVFVFLLAARVRSEEGALMALPEYARRMASKRRFIPGRER
ncbi:MAG: isoprenylcysteine carboxylmethyltransferase family protein [Acidobacteriota bacterium]